MVFRSSSMDSTTATLRARNTRADEMPADRKKSRNPETRKFAGQKQPAEKQPPPRPAEQAQIVGASASRPGLIRQHHWKSAWRKLRVNQQPAQAKNPKRRANETLPTAVTFSNVSLPGQGWHHGATFSPSHRTVHCPSSGNPGAFRLGAPSQPAAIKAAAYNNPPFAGR